MQLVRTHPRVRTYAGILKVGRMFVTAFDGVGARGDLKFVGLSDCRGLSVWYFFFFFLIFPRFASYSGLSLKGVWF